MKIIPSLGFQIPEILLPHKDIDPQKWSVIACDQFTSEPGYWKEVAELVGDSPSTYHMILPEILLGTQEEESRLQSTQSAMRDYVKQGVFQSIHNLILVERKSSGKTRHGLMIALDLEHYDFNKGSQTLIRATEGTIIERLPPRIKIREKALLEMPHILVLIDDPDRTVIEPLVAEKDHFKRLYDFDLMLGSGHLSGYEIENPLTEQQVISALSRLADEGRFRERYAASKDNGLLLFAIGDGNHSLATAKSIWEKVKPHVPQDHPARFALVELENVHDEGLEFEPIHRILFNVKFSLIDSLKDYFQDQVSIQKHSSMAEVARAIHQQERDRHAFGYIDAELYAVITVDRPTHNLPVGTLQSFLDTYLQQGKAEKIDYVHGTKVVEEIGKLDGNASFFLPPMSKNDLFKTVVLDGALPRKTFSMGEAKDKRFYMECRLIA